MDETQITNHKARAALVQWQESLLQNVFSSDQGLVETLSRYFANQPMVLAELTEFGAIVPRQLEPLVIENSWRWHLPRHIPYDGVGVRVDTIDHHPSYATAGDLIYGTKCLSRLRDKGFLEALSFFFLSSMAGEAGHNCPVACSAGILRVLDFVANCPNKAAFAEKLCHPSYQANFTGAQFLTEIQGGSDVGQNATFAEKQAAGCYRIWGEKWFCSNANADLILMTARYDHALEGTKGLGLFLVPAKLADGSRNAYTIRRLKEKIGTQTLASGEMDFHGAVAYPVEPIEHSFKLLMENVLHTSRLFNVMTVVAMARRAYTVAKRYAEHRQAFGMPIMNYPLIQETLAEIQVENTALMVTGFALASLQDQVDQQPTDEKKQLIRLLANMCKYITALWSFDHIHHSLDILAGNGAIETFSVIPRLLRDSIVCENWEGTHNVMRMQILRDVLKYQQDAIFIAYLTEHASALKDLAVQSVVLERLKTLMYWFAEFRNQNQAVQTLLIKDLIDDMAVLYIAVMLAEDVAVNPSKQSCLDWFVKRRLLKERHVVNSSYLELLGTF